jgi:hypothetical protein
MSKTRTAASLRSPDDQLQQRPLVTPAGVAYLAVQDRTGDGEGDGRHARRWSSRPVAD